MITNSSHITIQELANGDYISARSFSICKRFNLLNLNQILIFFENNGSFLKLQNCGRKTDEELTTLCRNYKIGEIEFVVGENESELVSINDLNPFKRLILNRQVECLISNLGVRAQNGIKFISPSGGVKEILETIYTKEFDFKKIQNIGNKTLKELELFKKQITNFLSTIKDLPNEDLNKEYALLQVKSIFKNSTPEIEAQFESLIDQSGKIKLFRLLSLLIESEEIFNKNEKRIFTSIFMTPCNNEESLESIAAELNLSRERIRQLRSILLDNIQSYLPFLTNFVTTDFVNYEIESLNSFKTLDDAFSELVNIDEDVKFNTRFYCSILYVFLKKTHAVLGYEETGNEKKRIIRNRRLKNCYLISRNVFDFFDFNLLIENISDQLNSKIPEAYSLHFEGFLLQFTTVEHKYLLKDIAPICEAIILNEFDLVINFDGYLVFERNTKIPFGQYIFEIMDCKGSKMKLTDICTAINAKFPGVELNEITVRTILRKERESFIYFGRSSTYGLRKWEFEKVNIKGGTIRGMIEEYLRSESEPKHISEILKYVKKYRSTNERSVLTNLEADDRNCFKFFDGDYVGLTSKVYNLEKIHFKRVVGAHFVRNMLLKFNGVDLEKTIDHYVNKYGYAPIQVRFLFEKKVLDKYMEITPDNKIKL